MVGSVAWMIEEIGRLDALVRQYAETIDGLAELKTRVATLEGAAAGIVQGVVAEVKPVIEGLKTRIETLETAMAAIQSQAQKATIAPDSAADAGGGKGGSKSSKS